MKQQDLHRFWDLANQIMVAKLISELAYEQAFQIKCEKTVKQAYPAQEKLYLPLDSGVNYFFSGWRNIWGQYVITPSSISRQLSKVTNQEQQHDTVILASTFLLDAKKELGFVDENLSEHLEDLYATLVADCKLMSIRENVSAKQFIEMDINHQQCLFNGHPKFAFNKGRRGWGSDDLNRYAPESMQSFQLGWIAAKKHIIQYAVADDYDWQKLIDSALDASEQKKVGQVISQYNINLEDYLLIPVHPWQWQNKLSHLFAERLANQDIVYLGEWGDQFLPQLSIRTLANISRPEGFDIKLPLTIMNTSCYRGIPSRYILAGPQASSWLNKVFQKDAFFQKIGAEILQEPASAFIKHPVYNQLENAPYRFHELLGVIWREGVDSKLASNEKAVLMAALMEVDCDGDPIINTYINASGYTAAQWLEQLFKVVVLPFYHLLCKYGVSLIAHGQNITIIMEDNLPKRILLKDFQGDMRLVNRSLPENEDLPEEVKAATVQLPEELIIHDLQTGHFVTVLRFISPLTMLMGVTEKVFYGLLGNVINNYMAQFPELSERYKRLDLFKPKILRIGLNLAKFRHQTDSSQSRMLPDMEQQLDNPLYISLNETVSSEGSVHVS